MGWEGNIWVRMGGVSMAFFPRLFLGFGGKGEGSRVGYVGVNGDMSQEGSDIRGNLKGDWV